jgi:hypothetical protein
LSSRVELDCDRADRALLRLQRLESQRIPRKIKTDLGRLIAYANFHRGKYAECESAARKALSGPAVTKQAAALYALLARLSACKEDYGSARDWWERATNAVVEKLRRKLSLPYQLQDWLQLTDEIGGLSEVNELFPYVWRLCETRLNQAICVWRLDKGDPSPVFQQALNAIGPLNLVDAVSARPRHLAARIYRAYAAYCQSKEKKEETELALQSALALEDDAIAIYTFETKRRPGDLNVVTWLTWSYFVRFDCLHRKLQSAPEQDRSRLEEDREEARRKCKLNLDAIARIPDKHYQAEVAYARASIEASELNAPAAVKFLRDALDRTRSSETGFSNFANRAKLDPFEDFANVRSDPLFRALLYGPPTTVE